MRNRLRRAWRRRPVRRSVVVPDRAEEPQSRLARRVDVYAVIWNDLPMLPYFLRHYRPLNARFWLFDDGSTDGTLDYLSRQEDVHVRPFANDGESFEFSAVALYDEAWRQSRGEAEWVVVCDIDEHLFHPNLPDYLDRSRAIGVTAIPALGYQMVAESFPDSDRRLCDEVVRGTRWPRMDKLMLFDPEAVDAINYAPGRHACAPRGRVVVPSETEVKLLHYRYLGIDYVLRRNRELGARLGPTDVKHNFGHKYRWGEAELRADFDQFVAASSNVI
jgi:hypothetical protein